jgi:hypothetical protein
LSSNREKIFFEMAKGVLLLLAARLMWAITSRVPPMSLFYYFRSSSRSDLHGFAGDRSGARLPSEDGPWRFVRAVDPATGWTAAAEIDAVRAGIHANGFFLADTPGDIAFDEPPVKPGD